MNRFFSRPSGFRCLVHVQVACLGLACLTWSQTSYSIQDVQVSHAPVIVARSQDPSDVLRASLATILHDKSVCCGRDSALAEEVAKLDPLVLKDIAAKLQGRHLLGDGRPIMVTAEYLDPASINSGRLITTLHDQHALLMTWSSHLYVCYGVTYRRDYDASTGATLNTIINFLLLDTRYSDSRRKVRFNRETDDWSQVHGMLYATSSRQ